MPWIFLRRHCTPLDETERCHQEYHYNLQNSIWGVIFGHAFHLCGSLENSEIGALRYWLVPLPFVKKPSHMESWIDLELQQSAHSLISDMNQSQVPIGGPCREGKTLGIAGLKQRKIPWMTPRDRWLCNSFCQYVWQGFGWINSFPLTAYL